MKRYYGMIFAASLAGGCAMYAQENPLSAEVKQAYNGIKNNLTKMAEKMPEDAYSFKATPDVRTFGELVAHVADAQARTCSTVMGEQKAVNAGSKKTKAELVAALSEAFSICDAAYDGLTDASAAQMVKTPRGERSKLAFLEGNIAHDNEEYGYMSVYMRLKGVVPPSSDRSR